MLETRMAARRPALGPQAAFSARGIAVEALPPASRHSLRLRESEAAHVEDAAGFRLNLPILRAHVAGDRLSLRLGPDEWLLLGPDRDGEAIAAAVDAALAGRFFSLVDVSHRSVGIGLRGRHAAEVLNAGCPIDLSLGAFPVGAATRTLLGKAEIVLLRLEEERFRVECWRSFAAYVHGFLREAARDFEAP